MKQCEKCNAAMGDAHRICSMCGWEPLSEAEKVCGIVPLDDRLWEQLRSAYGSAAPIASVLRAIEAADPANEEQLQSAIRSSDFWGHLDHQGTVYQASFAAIPHMVRIADKLPPSSETRSDLLVLVGSIAADGGVSIADRDVPEWREAFMPATLDAYGSALRLIYESLATRPSEDTTKWLLAATAGICGYSGLSENMRWLDDPMVECPECGHIMKKGEV